MKQTLLVELLTEELPPKALLSLGLTFRNAVIAGLAGAKFVDADSQQSEEVLVTPRRLAVTVRHVAAVQADQEIERKGPYVSQGLDADGKPTKALLGFARSCGVEVDALEKGQDAKGAHYVFRSVKRGEPLDEHLADIVTQALKKLPTPKVMRWGDRDVQFVRPVHGLMLLHGDRVVRGEVLGIAGSNATRGHRFMGEGVVTVPNAEAYVDALARRGAVIADFTQRRKTIVEALAGEAARLKAVLHEDEALLDEVTALVEFPVVYSGAFESDFLAVPQECLILSMKQHQKYFPLFDAKGKLLPRFLIVSNLKTADPSDIVRGNERVLRARLSDARFFFEQDRKRKLADRVPRLGDVVYHNKLGTQLERVTRIQKLAGHIAEQLGADVVAAERAAWLCKADLLTDMVGEFPELQGIMGRHYALFDGEDPRVADAIGDQYRIRLDEGTSPANLVSMSLFLADRVETLVGIWGIGLQPTGEKDPFGLRRAALGLINIFELLGGVARLSGQPLRLRLEAVLKHAATLFSAGAIDKGVVGPIREFVYERYRNQLIPIFDRNAVDAVIVLLPPLHEVVPRIKAVIEFGALPEAASLAAANKRIGNILKKTETSATKVDASLLAEPAEKALAKVVEKVRPDITTRFEASDYAGTLRILAETREPVDAFFNDVMVMTEDQRLRDNRIALLRELHSLMNQVADISRLVA